MNEALTPLSVKERRTHNMDTLGVVIQDTTSIPWYVRQLHGFAWKRVPEAMALGIALGRAPEDRNQLTTAVDVFIDEMRHETENPKPPSEIRHVAGDIWDITRYTKPDKSDPITHWRQDRGLIGTLLDRFDTVKTTTSDTLLRSRIAQLTAVTFVAVYGHNPSIEGTEPERLRVVKKSTEIVFDATKGSKWHMPVDIPIPEVPEPPLSPQPDPDTQDHDDTQYFLAQLRAEGITW